jgi:hypothetical protein
VEQELPTLPEHMSSPQFLVWFVLLDLYFYVYVLGIVVCPFVLFILASVLSVRLRYTASEDRATRTTLKTGVNSCVPEG